MGHIVVVAIASVGNYFPGAFFINERIFFGRAITGKPNTPEFSGKPWIRSCRIITMTILCRIRSMMESAEKIGNLQSERECFVSQEMKIFIGHISAPTLKMFIFQLHENNRTSMIYLIAADNGK